MTNRLRIAVPAAVVLILAPTMFVGTAHSEPIADKVIVPASKGHQAPSSAEQIDLEIIAKNDRISVDEANLRYGWQEEFTQALAAVSSRYPDQYVSAEMPIEQGGAARVVFTGGVPSEAKSYFKNLPVRVEIEGGAKASAKKIESDVEAVSRVARSVSDSPLGVEVIDDVIVVTAKQPAEDRVGSLVLSELQEAIEKAGLDLDQAVQVRSVDDLRAKAQVVVYGGGPLSTCTSGFTVRRTSGTELGIITADHCSDSQAYDGYPVLTYRSRLLTSQGDMQYMASSDSVGYSFYNDRGRLSPQSGVGTPARNMAICVFGVATNVKKCTTVKSTTPLCVDERTNYRGYCGLISSNANVTINGDSGGPWSYGTTVYGITHGRWLGPSVFTPLYNNLSRLGITLRN